MSNIFASLLDKMGATPKPSARVEMTRASSSDSTMSVITVDDASNAQSPSSTPPTSIGDTVSISSACIPLDKSEMTSKSNFSGRSRRQRTSVGTYNVKVLSGTAIHAPKKYSKNITETGSEPRRRTISASNTEIIALSDHGSSDIRGNGANRTISDQVDALDLEWPTKQLPKHRNKYGLGDSLENTAKPTDLEHGKSTRKSGEQSPIVTKRLSVLGKRSRGVVDIGLSAKGQRELKRLADTNEFAKIDTNVVIKEVWRKGKLEVEAPTTTRGKVRSATAKSPAQAPKISESKKVNRKKEKIWLSMGLYAGQEPTENLNWFKGYKGPKEKEIPIFKPDGTLPLPMWHGQQLLFHGRDFKLPFDVCCPLPPGQPKPDEWRKTSSNRFVGDAGALWKKSSLFDSFSSKCVCTPEGGCDEDCQNRIMLYECDDTNCASGRDHCTNRAFAELQERRKEGGKYRIGVEVIKTADRGYGVRSNRCFDANQIIVEYTGEIITEDECDRRMNEDYKNNECYYLMSFDQNMIIDATKGSIARFVNHSCRPNCRMVKWIVGGKPRMALFAGDKAIMSGDELTYDYNFDPFSAKNVQQCRCGSDNCRGVLGPKPKPVKDAIKDAVKAGVKAVKRKAKELLVGDRNDEGEPSPKRRHVENAAAVKRSSSSMKSAKGATAAVKKPRSGRLGVRKPVNAKRGILGRAKVQKSIHARTHGRSTKSLPNQARGERIKPRNKSSRRSNQVGLRRNAVLKDKRGRRRSPPLEDVESGTIRVMAVDGDYGEDSNEVE